jgi:hypothetical protein
MDNATRISILKSIADAIFKNAVATNIKLKHPAFFTDQQADHIITGRWFSDETLRGIDFKLDDNGTIRHLRMLEQNPKKMKNGVLSQYAIAARSGKKIAWIIDRESNKFIGRIEDGVFITSKPSTTTKTPGPYRGTYREVSTPTADNIHCMGDIEDMASDLPYVGDNELESFIGGESW